MPLLTIKAQVHADRETEEQTGRSDIRRSNLNRVLATLPRAKGYYSMSTQLTRDEVRQAYRSFFALRKNGRTEHNSPGFRPQSYLSPLKYVQSGFECEGIGVRESDERGTSRTCHACDQARKANRGHRGLYRCECGWIAQADVNGALNIYERAFQVSPVKGSSGRVARPVVLSFQPGWHTVHEPKRKGPLRASA